MDELKANKAWKEYYKAIKKFKLHKIKDMWHQKKKNNIPFMQDVFFAGYYAGRNDSNNLVTRS
jgi:hypothetical protein